MNAYYFGAEREVTMQYPEGTQGFPNPKDLPIPNATWKDFYQEINQPFEGESLQTQNFFVKS